MHDAVAPFVHAMPARPCAGWQPAPAAPRRAPAAPARRLHAEGRGRRPQAVRAHRRIRRRRAGRDLHRAAQGRPGVPRPDGQFRPRRQPGAAARRAAGGVRRGVHLHPLRPRRRGGGRSGGVRTRRRCSTTRSAIWRRTTWAGAIFPRRNRRRPIRSAMARATARRCCRWSCRRRRRRGRGGGRCAWSGTGHRHPGPRAGAAALLRRHHPQLLLLPIGSARLRSTATACRRRRPASRPPA